MPRKLKRTTKRKTPTSGLKVSHSSSIGTRAGPSIKRYSGLRTFQFFPPAFSDSTPSNSWLTHLLQFGAIALKLYTMSFGKIRHQGKIYAQVAPTSTSQSMIFGADDIMYNSPIAEIYKYTTTAKKTVDRYFVGYTQARISRFIFLITPGSELSKRAGRYAVAVVPLSYDQAYRYMNEKASSQVLVSSEDVPYEMLITYPGAVTCSADKPTKISANTTGHSAQWHEIGSRTVPADIVSFRGGIPLVKLIFSYQDMASSVNNPSQLYSADEALFQVDVSANLMLREPGEAFLRQTPIVGQDAKLAAIRTRSFKRYHSIPFESLTLIDGALHCEWISELEEVEECFVDSGSSQIDGFEDLTIV